MRKGSNPSKEDNALSSSIYHRVIIPVYIPNHEGYFIDSFKIFKICIESLLNSIHSQTAVTIINNACCQDVTAYLQDIYFDKKIDCLINNKENKGKIDPLMSVIRGCYEPLITISDADVLFKPHWQEETEKIITASSKVGLVCLVPSPLGYKSSASTTILSGLIKNKIKFGPTLDRKGMETFDKSLGNLQPLYKNIHLEYILYYKLNNNLKAVVGGGHFVATVRRDALTETPQMPSLKKVMGNSEHEYIDVPIDKKGMYKLSTERCYAYHLGNIFENWMQIYLEEYLKNKNSSLPLKDFTLTNKVSGITIFPYKIRLLLYSILLNKYYFKRLFFIMFKAPFSYHDY